MHEVEISLRLYHGDHFVFTEMQDFSATTVQLTFQAGLDVRIQCAEIPILNDVILEDNEEFTVQLSTTEADAVTLGLDSASIIIADDDSMCNAYKLIIKSL